MKTNSRRVLSGALLLSLMAVCFVSLSDGGQQSSGVLPTVVSIGIPGYPHVARVARLEGVVHVRVTTDGQGVTGVEVQDGPQLLAAPAQDNVRTWQFAPHKPTSFVVTYRYKLVKNDTGNPTVVLRLPTDVEISSMWPETADFTPNAK